MDIESLHSRRHARTLTIRRRRRRAAAGLLALAAIALSLVLLLGRAGGSGARSQGSARTAGSQPLANGATRATVPGGATAGTGASTATGAAGGRPGHEPVPILMYHVIAPAPAGAPFPGLYVPPSEFAAQMQALHDAGWTAVTSDQVAANWRRGVPLPAGKPIVLSFDNGYHSQYAQALPVLRKLGWVGEENIQLTGLPPSQGGLSSSEVRALIAAGWELDTQGTSHADLIRLSPPELRSQVAGTRAILRRRYGVPVNWFCYPSGHYDAAVIAAVKTAGYVGSTTVVPGWAHPADDPYRLHRLRVLGGTTPQALLALIAATRGNAAAPASYGGA